MAGFQGRGVAAGVAVDVGGVVGAGGTAAVGEGVAGCAATPTWLGTGTGVGVPATAVGTGVRVAGRAPITTTGVVATSVAGGGVRCPLTCGGYDPIAGVEAAGPVVAVGAWAVAAGWDAVCPEGCWPSATIGGGPGATVGSGAP